MQVITDNYHHHYYNYFTVSFMTITAIPFNNFQPIIPAMPLGYNEPVLGGQLILTIVVAVVVVVVVVVCSNTD